MKYLKIISLIIINLLILIFIFKEIKFLFSGTYTSSFIDIFDQKNTIPILIISISLVIYQLLRHLKPSPARLVLVILIPLIIIILFGLVNMRLNTKNHLIYRQDLGIQTVYLYLSNNSNKYILDYLYPFGKTTLIGTYFRNNEVIYLDKNLNQSLNISATYSRIGGDSLILDKFEQIK